MLNLSANLVAQMQHLLLFSRQALRVDVCLNHDKTAACFRCHWKQMAPQTCILWLQCDLTSPAESQRFYSRSENKHEQSLKRRLKYLPREKILYRTLKFSKAYRHGWRGTRFHLLKDWTPTCPYNLLQHSNMVAPAMDLCSEVIVSTVQQDGTAVKCTFNFFQVLPPTPLHLL